MGRINLIHTLLGSGVQCFVYVYNGIAKRYACKWRAKKWRVKARRNVVEVVIAEKQGENYEDVL